MEIEHFAPWHVFDTLLSESMADSVDIRCHINNKIVQYKYKDSACVCVCVHVCMVVNGMSNSVSACVSVCSCEPVLGQHGGEGEGEG